MTKAKTMQVLQVPAYEPVRLFSKQRDVMNINEVADALGVDPRTVRREIGRERLRCIHVGTRVLVSKTALLEYVGEAIA